MSKLGYRDSTVLLAGGFFLLCICWIWFGSETSGRYALRENGALNWRGWFALICGLVVFAVSLPHICHVLLRRPALQVGEGELHIWMLPYETIPLIDISRIEVGDGSIDIFRHGKGRRRINARILDQPRTFFFDEVKRRITDPTVVQEK